MPIFGNHLLLKCSINACWSTYICMNSSTASTTFRPLFEQYKILPACLNISLCTSKLLQFFKRLFNQPRRTCQRDNKTRHWKASLQVTSIILAIFQFPIHNSEYNIWESDRKTYLITEASTEGSSTRIAQGLHLGSFWWVLSTRVEIHLWILWPGELEVMTQAIGIGFWEESNTSREHKAYCKSQNKKSK